MRPRWLPYDIVFLNGATGQHHPASTFNRSRGTTAWIDPCFPMYNHGIFFARKKLLD